MRNFQLTWTKVKVCMYEICPCLDRYVWMAKNLLGGNCEIINGKKWSKNWWITMKRWTASNELNARNLEEESVVWKLKYFKIFTKFMGFPCYLCVEFNIALENNENSLGQFSGPSAITLALSKWDLSFFIKDRFYFNSLMYLVLKFT